jgi:hypothetical protein
MARRRSRPALLAAIAIALPAALLALDARADVLATLSDAKLFKQAQADVAGLPRPELDALNGVVATCSAVSLGQRQQHFECERDVNRYWAEYNRDRALDRYIASVGGLFAGFDNALNPTQPMMKVYRQVTVDLVQLTRTINARYRALQKP